jgi:hypothetical protein
LTQAADGQRFETGWPRKRYPVQEDRRRMQDARYIPPRRWRDRTPRRWRDRLVVRRLALAAVLIIVVALVVFVLIYWRA